MVPLTVLALQCSLSCLVFGLIAKRYLIPILESRTRVEGLALLLLLNMFRYLPLSLFMPGQVSSQFPYYLKELIAYGDCLAALLALLAYLLLQWKEKAGYIFTWIFSIVGIIDILLVLTAAVREEIYTLPLGTNYFTVSLYVPLVIISQILILTILGKKTHQIARA